MQGKREPQAYIDALRKGDYVFAAIGLSKLMYAKYQSLSKRVLFADDVTPLLRNLFAETDLSINDLPLIQFGILYNQASNESEVTYYLTQMMASAAELLSHEEWLREQEGNRNKSPKDIRQLVRDEITEAFKKQNGLQEAERITEGKMGMDPGVLVAKETTYKKTWAYAVNHLINENNVLIRETGKILLDRLDEVGAKIEELDRKAVSKEGDKEIVRLWRETRKHQREVEDQLSILMVQPKEFHANKALSWVMDQDFLYEVKQQTEAYLNFLNNNPVDEPEKHKGLLKTYDARKYATAMMLTAIKTAFLRPPQATLAILQDNAKKIENNRPGFWELGIVAWIIDHFIKKSEMTKITDMTLKLTKDEIKKLGTNNFFYKKAHHETISERSGHEVVMRRLQG
ncbi:hypothetical protein [Legionella sp. WA2024007413]